MRERQAFTSDRRQGGTLTQQLVDILRGRLLDKVYIPGNKLPSEAQLLEEFGVSRTVVREAISILREDGLVMPRQGAGVFVREPADSAIPGMRGVDPRRLSSVVEGLELRTAIEVEAAFLAAVRCSPQQAEAIVSCHQEVGRCIAAGLPTVSADLALHLAIAEGSNNRQFVNLLMALGSGMIPRATLDEEGTETSTSYLAKLHDEHREIVAAITNGDQLGAREAMRVHLRGSQERYRAILAKSDFNL